MLTAYEGTERRERLGLFSSIKPLEIVRNGRLRLWRLLFMKEREPVALNKEVRPIEEQLSIDKAPTVCKFGK